VHDARSNTESLGNLARSYELVWCESAGHAERVRTPHDNEGLRMIMRNLRVNVRTVVRI
jgi:hypothetical protein